MRAAQAKWCDVAVSAGRCAAPSTRPRSPNCSPDCPDRRPGVAAARRGRAGRRFNAQAAEELDFCLRVRQIRGEHNQKVG